MSEAYARIQEGKLLALVGVKRAVEECRTDTLENFSDDLRGVLQIEIDDTRDMIDRLRGKRDG